MNKREDNPGLLQGTLDLLILKTLASLGTQHGFGIARRIEKSSGQTLSLNQGTIYPALLRLEQRGLIQSEIGVSDNKRRARFYSITAKGKLRLGTEITLWRRMSATVEGILTNDSAQEVS